MKTVQEAEQIIFGQVRDYGTERVSLEYATGRTLAEDILTDRDLPPYDRVTMDGIAINYSAFASGNRGFRIKATMAAGDVPLGIDDDAQCIELMTGCALPMGTNTVVRYEDLKIEEGTATILIDSLREGQNIHKKGSDKKQLAAVVTAGRRVDAAVISMAASVGKSSLLVKKLPRTVILSTGDELVGIDERPSPYQVRRSNSYAIQSVLQQHNVPADLTHIPDDKTSAKAMLESYLNVYDVIILSGGISMGKFDHVANTLVQLNVVALFHKVKQRPGKPFWFGAHPRGNIVFAFPGNPVSAFMCLHRYFIPWLEKVQAYAARKPIAAVLAQDFAFAPALQYFLQVKLELAPNGQLMATPVEGNGSGDFSNLLESDAFMELPAGESNFKKGDVYPVWPFKQII
jgi:molybdopterin molybdotransferase